MNIYRQYATAAELEREYSPSSCAGDPSPILDLYEQKSRSVREMPGVQTIAYGPHPAEQFDFYPAASAAGDVARPVVIYIHGGYWQELSKDQHGFLARDLVRHDLSYIAVNYGNAPQASLEQMVKRCRDAFSFIASNAERLAIDAGDMHLAGCSAGAHLAAMVTLAAGASGTTPYGPRTLTLLSGVFDLRPLVSTYINDALGMSAAVALRNSPMFLLDGARLNWPKTLIVYGDNETAEFKRQSVAFADEIHRKAGTVSIHEIADRNHFDLLFDLADDTQSLGRLFLDQIGNACKE